MAEERQGVSRPHGDDLDQLTEYRQQQVWEYQEYVAAQDIYAGNALAYREGDPVPVSNVKLHSYDKNGMVRKRVEESAAKPAAKEKEAK